MVNLEVPSGSYIFYESFECVLGLLDDEDELAVRRAISAFVFGTEMPELSARAQKALNSMTPQLAANIDKRNNGRKGGRPPKRNCSKPQAPSQDDAVDNSARAISATSDISSGSEDVITTGFEIDETTGSENPKPNVNVNENVNVNVDQGGSPLTPLTADAAGACDSPPVLSESHETTPAPKRTRAKKHLSPELQDWFDHEFWPLYPRHEGKETARRAVASLKPDASLRVEIIAGLNRARECNENFRTRNTQFIPHPSVWLNQRRWEDEYASAPVQQDRASPQQPGPQFEIPGVGGAKLPPDANLRELFPNDYGADPEQWEADLRDMQEL